MPITTLVNKTILSISLDNDSWLLQNGILNLDKDILYIRFSKSINILDNKVIPEYYMAVKGYNSNKITQDRIILKLITIEDKFFYVYYFYIPPHKMTFFSDFFAIDNIYIGLNSKEKLKENEQVELKLAILDNDINI